MIYHVHNAGLEFAELWTCGVLLILKKNKNKNEGITRKSRPWLDLKGITVRSPRPDWPSTKSTRSTRYGPPKFHGRSIKRQIRFWNRYSLDRVVHRNSVRGGYGCRCSGWRRRWRWRCGEEGRFAPAGRPKDTPPTRFISGRPIGGRRKRPPTRIPTGPGRKL